MIMKIQHPPKRVLEIRYWRHGKLLRKICSRRRAGTTCWICRESAKQKNKNKYPVPRVPVERGFVRIRRKQRARVSPPEFSL